MENRAVMFKKKEGDTSNRPEFTVKLNCEGKEKEIGFFLSDKQTKNGDPMWTGKVNEPFKKSDYVKPAPVKEVEDDDFDDEICF